MTHFDYTDGHSTFEGYLALNGDHKTQRPCVLVGHAWSGPGRPFEQMADELAKNGFIGFAIDVYGKGVRGKVDADNNHLMDPLIKDRRLLQKRLLAAFAWAQQHPLVCKNKIAILGHCFGGLCALDLARANPRGLAGAISVHGLLQKPDFSTAHKIDCSILVLHGWEDPMAKPEQVLNLTQEMTDARADWQLHCYGHALHAFTFIGADLPQLGIRYNQKAHQRSNAAILQFLNEIFN